MKTVFQSTVRTAYKSVLGQPLDLTVHEGSSPLVRLAVVKVEDGTESAVDFNGTNPVQFIAKPDVDSPDPSPWYTYPAGGITLPAPLTAGVLLVQFQATDLSAPGSSLYRVDAWRGTVRTVLAFGALRIVNS